jgi:hypothetical protein
VKIKKYYIQSIIEGKDKVRDEGWVPAGKKPDTNGCVYLKRES